MASAAIAAPPMASTSFQSANKAFNERAPYCQVSGSTDGAEKSRMRLSKRSLCATGDADLDDVPGQKRADACGRARGDDVAGIQRHHAGDPADEKCGRVNHQGCAAGLPERAVDARLDKNTGWVELGFDMRANGTKRIEALAASELNVAFLKVARGDVVETRIARHERK